MRKNLSLCFTALLFLNPFVYADIPIPPRMVVQKYHSLDEFIFRLARNDETRRPPIKVSYGDFSAVKLMVPADLKDQARKVGLLNSVEEFQEQKIFASPFGHSFPLGKVIGGAALAGSLLLAGFILLKKNGNGVTRAILICTLCLVGGITAGLFFYGMLEDPPGPKEIAPIPATLQKNSFDVEVEFIPQGDSLHFLIPLSLRPGEISQTEIPRWPPYIRTTPRKDPFEKK